MLKLILIIAAFVNCGVVNSQGCDTCALSLTYDFLNFPIPKDTLPVFHNIVYKGNTKTTYNDNSNNPRTEEYHYIHNGDNLKGAEDIFTGGVQQGSGWLKNFDFGKFANITIELSGDNRSTGSAFVWTGELVFLKLFNKKQLSTRRHYND